MSGNKLFTDTNIVLYLLAGDQTLATILEGKNIYLSFVTELELLGYTNLKQEDEKQIRQFLKQCTIIDINASIKEEVIRLRQLYMPKLPDGIIMASSIHLDIPLITSDKDFKRVEDLDLLFYDKS